MFRTKDQKAFLKAQRRALLDQFAAYCESGDMTALHQWRLGIKKTRALLSLPGWAGRKLRHSEVLQAVDELYARSGKIRQHYLNQQRLAEVRPDPEPGPEPASGPGPDPELEAAAGQAGASDAARPPRPLTRKPRKALRLLEQYARLLREQCRPLPDRAIREHFRKRRRHIARLISKGLSKDPEALHNARTALKKLMYVHQALTPSLQQQLRLETAYLDQLQEAIGNWRDASLAAEAAEAGQHAGLHTAPDARHAQNAEAEEPAAEAAQHANESDNPSASDSPSASTSLPPLRAREAEALEHVRELAVNFEQKIRRPKADKA